MTKEEAIQILSTRDWSGMLCGYTSGYTEALDMAIEALKKEIERHEMVIRASERHLGIVRCKDCKHRSDGRWCDIYIQPRIDTDFCNHGERLCNHNWREGGDLE